MKLTQEIKKDLIKSAVMGVVFGIIAGVLSINLAFAGSSASANANATATVLASITITKVNDLRFGNGIQGDAAKVVAASDANAASFNVGGTPNAAFNITLPSSITMTNGSGGSITVNSFTSTPSTSGTLNGSGTQTLSVGATRAALPANQATGSYTGSFTVTVAYQ